MAKEEKRVKAGSAAAQRLEDRIKFVEEYIKLWQQFFERFADGFENRKILKRDEDEFARILNSLAHHHYRFTAMVYPNMRDTGGIIKILCSVISLSHLKSLSEAQLSKVQNEWHTLFIDMNKALGRMMARRPLTPEEEQMMKTGEAPPEKPAASAPHESPSTNEVPPESPS